MDKRGAEMLARNANSPQARIADMCDEGKTVLFYPSSGVDPGPLTELPYDIFVLSDRSTFRQKCMDRQSAMERWGQLTANTGLQGHIAGAHYLDPAFVAQTDSGKWIFFFPCDNNEVLDMLGSAGVKLSCLLGIKDGCVDGGNHECVNGWHFLAAAFSIMHPMGMDYYLDHSWMLDRVNATEGSWDTRARPNSPEGPYPEFVLSEAYMRLLWNVRIEPPGEPGQTGERGAAHAYLQSEVQLFLRSVHVRRGELLRYRITPHVPTVRKWEFGHVRLTVEHDNIANHLRELDVAIVSRRGEKICKCRAQRGLNYGSALDRVELPSYVAKVPHYFYHPRQTGKNSGDSMRFLLLTASDNGWRVVGTTAFGGGEHTSILEALDLWGGQQPLHVRVFHLDAGDFQDIA
jgi:hypothetical protein